VRSAGGAFYNLRGGLRPDRRHPVVIADVIYFGSFDGRMYALAVQPSGPGRLRLTPICPSR
jgi:hypothetical protein